MTSEERVTSIIDYLQENYVRYGLTSHYVYDDYRDYVKKQIREAEQASAAAIKERCAEIAESYTPPGNMSYSTYDIGLKDASREIAQKIREQVVGD